MKNNKSVKVVNLMIAYVTFFAIAMAQGKTSVNEFVIQAENYDDLS